MDEKRIKNLTSLRKYSKKKLMHGNNKKGVKISFKRFTKNMDKELYIKILEEKLPKVRKYSNEDWQLQFDNDPKYTSKMALEYLKEKKVNVSKWPPYFQICYQYKTFEEY